MSGDPMSGDPFRRVDKSLISPKLLERVSDVLALMREEAQFVLTCGFRSGIRQAELYSQGRSKPGRIVTNSKPFESMHQFGLAVNVVRDLAVDNGTQPAWSGLKLSWRDADYVGLGEACRDTGLDWGGNWRPKGMPHMQIPGFRSQKELEPLRLTWNEMFCRGLTRRKCLEACWRIVGW